VRLGLGTAALLSLLFILEAGAMAGIVAGAIGLVQLPVIPFIDPNVAAILIVGAGLLIGFGVLYKSYS